MDFKELYNQKVIETINLGMAKLQSPIFVFCGQSSILEFEKLGRCIADEVTFCKHGDEEIFTRDWFVNIFSVLNRKNSNHLVSLAKFSYLITYIDINFFKDRIVLIEEGLRKLFPLNDEDYLGSLYASSEEERPNKLPIYQAEQFIINGKCYFSQTLPEFEFEKLYLFTKEKDLQESSASSDLVIDINTDLYSIDVFINECIASGDFEKKIHVKVSNKNKLNEISNRLLKRVNFLLSVFGGGLYSYFDTISSLTYQPTNDSLQLLKKYWGNNSEFRLLDVYEDPETSNNTVELSQGFIVDLIIKEYNNSKLRKHTRDVFLTAPTGAGKSLLFQIPSFYVSNSGDVTIVVSPLIALMKDQVQAVKQDRGFEKVAYLNSELSLIEREQIIEACKSGDIDILYLSPELLLSYSITHFLGERNLGLLVIDEAHLITTWGRDFRVDYWFLGNHIKKIRKHHNLTFPMVAVTATDIYGGTNDMVFDSLDSLAMIDPHIFIGKVKRNDIEFVINNYEKLGVNYETEKLNQTISFIEEVDKLKCKTLVYVPYTKHVEQIKNHFISTEKDIIAAYYGSLDSDAKEYGYQQFKVGEKKIMVSTKAFGMGIDISDIQIVYHHAPSGLLSDYVQEIGRVARKQKLKGYAALSYSSDDQRFSKMLHGMSALRTYQLKEVLRKIHHAYLRNNKQRNLLMSIDDFGYIFDNAKDVDQKVLTALMMIEKDYLAKSRFNVIIARPRKLFVKVFGLMSHNDYLKFSKKYDKFSKIKSERNDGDVIVEIELDKIWTTFFKNESFPTLKWKFFQKSLFSKSDEINVEPQLRVKYILSKDFEIVNYKLKSVLDFLSRTFSDLSSKYFTYQEFNSKVKEFFDDSEVAEKVTKYILSTFTGKGLPNSSIDTYAFLQQRKDKIKGFGYKIINNQYLATFNNIRKAFSSFGQISDDNSIIRYINTNKLSSVNYIRLGYLIEVLDLGQFELSGGENSMIFIRINDPNRISKDYKDKNYKNILLEKTLDRYEISNQIFDHFFLNSFSNDERWSFIEDYFLGVDIDHLKSKYPGGNANRISIIEYLKSTIEKNNTAIKNVSLDEKLHKYFPVEDKFYNEKNILTLETPNGIKTMRVSEWVYKDPRTLYLAKKRIKFKLEKNISKILYSKIKADHYDLILKDKGLNQEISFKGYKELVKASIPYHNNPIEFYKWWIKNQDKVYLNTKHKAELFYVIEQKAPFLLRDIDKKLIKKDN